jgi:urea carboxylase
MEGPGGYQFVGRTVPMWNRFRETAVFAPGKPWLLRFFDQVRFYEVAADELLELRRKMLLGDWSPRIEETHFDLTEYDGFLRRNEESIAAFRGRQQQAFAEERERWRAAGIDLTADENGLTESAAVVEIPDGCVAVESPMGGAVWKVEVRTGDAVSEKQVVIVLEAMKMELAVEVPVAGTVREVLVKTGDTVSAGEIMVVVERC